MQLIWTNWNGEHSTLKVDRECGNVTRLILEHEFLTKRQMEVPEWANRCIRVTQNGRPIESISSNSTTTVLEVFGTLAGGKGGFGSMLRAIGAQIEKTTNREACRDLSGRRLRDVNEEKRIKEYIKRQAEREEREKRQAKAKLEKLAAMTAPRDCQYNDEEFEKYRGEIPDIVDESITYAMQVEAKKNANKRKADDSHAADQPGTSGVEHSKKAKVDETKKTETIEKTKSATTATTMTKKNKFEDKMWLGIDLDDDDDSDSDDTSDDESNKKSSNEKRNVSTLKNKSK